MVALFRQWLVRVTPLLAPERGRVALGLLFVLLTSGLALVYPQVVRVAIDEGVQGGRMDRLAQLGLLLVAILLVEVPATFLRTYYFHMAARRTSARLRSRLLQHLLIQEIAFFDEQEPGEMNARLVNDTGMLELVIAEWIPEALRWSLQGACAIVLMIHTSPLLAGLILLVGPLLAITTSVLGKAIGRRTLAAADVAAAMHAATLESLQGIRTIRAFSQERAEGQRYEAIQQRFLAAIRRVIRAEATLDGLSHLASEAAIVLAIVAGGALIVSDQVSPGSVISFVFYAALVVRSFKQLSKASAEVLRSHGSTQRIFAWLDREPRLPIAGGARPPALEGELRLENVHFRYPGRPGKPVLRGIDLKIRPREFVALVGSSGAGKSTVASLVARFYDPDQGRILLDGRDIRELDPRWLRQHVTIVSQDASLFSRSIGENVCFGRKDASADELAAALGISQAAPFVDHLPEGLRTSVGDRGFRFSGGQRQRLAIARALLRRPRILILDEATSALDSEVEATLKEALRKLPEMPTILIVAHRLSTVVDMDRVIVLHEGRIVADGPHHELLRTSASYRDLVENQLVAQ